MQLPEREKNLFLALVYACLLNFHFLPRICSFSEQLAAEIFTPFKEIPQSSDLDQRVLPRQLYQITIAQITTFAHLGVFRLNNIAYQRKVTVFLSSLSHAEPSLICC